MEPIGNRPGLEDAANFGQECLEVGFLLYQQAPNVGAGCCAGAPQAYDVLDLRQREPQPAAPLDEAEQAKDVIGIDAIA